MADPGWWILHALQGALLVAITGFAFRAAWRVGGHTLYGTLLFLIGAGFWFILMGELIYVGHKGLGVWEGPGGFNDLLQLLGWVLVLASVALFVSRFTRTQGRVQGAIRLATFMAIPLLVTCGVLVLWISLPGMDPHLWLRATYIGLDAVTLGAILAGLDAFRRLRRGALGRLYVLLAVGLVLKTTGDLYWAYLAARGQTAPLATAIYPVAGAVVFAALAWHLKAMQREELPMARHAPWLRPEQRALCAMACRLQDTAGGYAARTSLLAAGHQLGIHGATWRIDGLCIEAEASPAAWQQAISAAESTSRQLLGVRPGPNRGRTP